METPRRSGAQSSSSTGTTRFPGLGGASSGYDGAAYATAALSAAGGGRGGARTDDELGFERWRESLRAQEDEQALLHQTVVSSKRQQLDAQHERLAKQRAFIRHEKRKLLLQSALLDSEKERFEASLSSDWFCVAAFPSVHDRRLTLDVGGQLFEISTPVTAKDSGSLLAALAADDSPLAALECGCFRVDRDAWLFRYVLHFLRDGLLPPDPKLLRELYLESEFWKLDSLRRAIELKNMELLQLKQDNDAKTAAAAAAMLLSSAPSSGATNAQAKYHLDSALLARMKASTMLPERSARDPHAWWLDAPTWWGAGDKKEPKLASVAASMKRAQLGDKATASNAEDSNNKGKSKDGGEDAGDAWWKSSAYKGKDFAQVLAAKAPVKSEDDGGGTPRSPLVLSSTWSSSGAQG